MQANGRGCEDLQSESYKESTLDIYPPRRPHFKGAKLSGLVLLLLSCQLTYIMRIFFPALHLDGLVSLLSPQPQVDG